MTGYLGKQTNWPDDVEGRRALEERNSQWGEIPGEIVAFDHTKQTATVQPLFKPKFNGVPVVMPQLLEVPVRFERAGGGALTFKIKPGDRVTLRPQMRSSENYHVDDDGSASDARSFNLSDMEAHIAGGESLKDPIQNFETDGTHLRTEPTGEFGLRGSEEGGMQLNAKKLHVKVKAGEFAHIETEPGAAIYLGAGPPWFPVMTTGGPSQHVFAGIAPAGSKLPDGWKG